MSLNYELRHKRKPAGAILLLHGMTGSPYEMKKYAQLLYSKGYDVFGYCLPGHGDSPVDIKEVTYTDWLNFSFEKYVALKRTYDEVFVSGLCLGAVLCLAVAQRFADVSGIICLSTTLFLDGWRMPWYSFLMPIALKTVTRFYYSFPESEPYGIKNLKTRKIIKKLLEKSEVALDNYPMSCIYELIKLSQQVRKNISKVETPILIIHSMEDDLTSIKSAKLVYNYVSSADKKLLILNDSYHMVLYDNEKDFVFEKSVEFLQQHSKISEGAFC